MKKKPPRNQKKRSKNRGVTSGRGARGRKKVWLNILPHDRWYELDKGADLFTVLQQVGVDIPSDCGGVGKCGKCAVRILTSIQAPRDEDHRKLLGDEKINQGMRLACRTRLDKDLTIYIGESEPDLDFFQILKVGQVPVVDPDPLVTRREVHLAAAGQEDGCANVELLRRQLEPDFPALQPTLSALRSLAGQLHGENLRGTAVIRREHEKNLLLAWKQGGGLPNFGLVFDLGTSTLVAKLVDLDSGKQAAAVSCLNSQQKYGADIISRIQYISRDENNLNTLHDLLVNDLRGLVERLLPIAGLRPEDIFVAVAAGNTTMQHLLLKIDPTGIAQAPFAPVIRDAFVAPAADAGLFLHPEAKLYLMPSKSGYIGGDLVSVILASQVADEEEKVILGIDLGTNGEMFLGNRDRIITCSTAAGPALEGARISCGSIARAGAIEGVRFQDGRLHYKDIGNIKPLSICGSGLVDLVAVLLHHGVIDSQGVIVPPPGPDLEFLRQRVVHGDGVNDFLVADRHETYHHNRILLTQKDVRELQYAKAAVAAGISLLAAAWGIVPLQVDRIYLAGALGNYINKYSGMRIGLLPMIEPERIISLGNAASAGAAMALMSRAHWRFAQELTHRLEHIELSTSRDFTEHYIAALDFPETNVWDRRL